jgi:hypothetical protein
MNHLDVIWSRLKERRREGECFPLRILILGPSDDASFERTLRCRVKEQLTKLGHGAVFPEDLCEQDGAWKDDILSDIVMQAKEADCIIMIYKTRGTQSERDILMSGLLDNHQFAQKSIVFVGSTIYKQIKISLTGQDWERLGKVAEVHVFDDTNSYEGIEPRILTTVEERTQNLRRLVYVRGLLKGSIC